MIQRYFLPSGHLNLVYEKNIQIISATSSHKRSTYLPAFSYEHPHSFSHTPLPTPFIIMPSCFTWPWTYMHFVFSVSNVLVSFFCWQISTYLSYSIITSLEAFSTRADSSFKAPRTVCISCIFFILESSFTRSVLLTD